MLSNTKNTKKIEEPNVEPIQGWYFEKNREKIIKKKSPKPELDPKKSVDMQFEILENMPIVEEESPKPLDVVKSDLNNYSLTLEELPALNEPYSAITFMKHARIMEKKNEMLDAESQKLAEKNQALDKALKQIDQLLLTRQLNI